MKIFVNGNPTNFEKSLTVSQLLNDLKIDQEDGIAVALNAMVIPTTELAQTHLNDGDNLEIIHATAGG